VDVHLLVSISKSKSVSCWLSWAYASRVKKLAQGKMYVNMHVQPANGGFARFALWHCYRVTWVAIRAELA
jgi:hypothetical protein